MTNQSTKTLILVNNADPFEKGPDSEVACAALRITAELEALCRQRVGAAELAYARDPSLAELSFHDNDGPQVFGDELILDCGRRSDEFHEDYFSHRLALMPDGVELDAFQPTRVESRRTLILSNIRSAPVGLNIAWVAVSVDTAAPVRTEAVTLEYLEQLLASDQPAACECEAPGYYRSGVPGILAHLNNGRLAPDAVVESCASCRRYSSDTAALEELRRLGIA